MAIASCHVSVISRGKGKCTVAAASYRSGEKIQDERTGKTYDYSRKLGIVYTDILTPQNVPEWAHSRDTLWNAAEQAEKRSNSRTARQIEIALPNELTLQQNIEAAKAYAQTFVNAGMIADLCIHDKNDGNPHAHILLTTRTITAEGFGEKVRAWDKVEQLEQWRKDYETTMNHYLTQAGSAARICVDSYEKQGIEQVPTIHLGHHAHQLEQAGIASVRGDMNREIQKTNQQLEEANHQLAVAEAALQKERETQANIERLNEMYRTAAEARGLRYRPLEPHERDAHIQQRREQQQQREHTPTKEEQQANLEHVNEMYRKATEERRKPQQPQELTPEQVEEYRQRAAQRGYHPEPRRILESEFANPERRKDEQEQGKKKEEEPQHHNRDTKHRKLSLEELDRMYREGAQEYNERRKQERERERNRESPDIPM